MCVYGGWNFKELFSSRRISKPTFKFSIIKFKNFLRNWKLLKWEAKKAPHKWLPKGCQLQKIPLTSRICHRSLSLASKKSLLSYFFAFEFLSLLAAAAVTHLNAHESQLAFFESAMSQRRSLSFHRLTKISFWKIEKKKLKESDAVERVNYKTK